MKRYIQILLTSMLICVLAICFAFTLQAEYRPENVAQLIQKSASETAVVLEWTKVKNADNYKLYMYDKTKKKYLKYGLFGTNTCTVTGLEPGETYRFNVKAIDNVDGKNYYSETGTFAEAVTTPEKVQNTRCTNKKKNSFRLKWDKIKNADGYQIYLLNKETGKWKEYKTTEKTSITLKKEGVYKVSAYKVNGDKKYYGTKSMKKTCSFKHVKSAEGTFTFVCYGVGHGVGLSQNGAQVMAKNGKKYDEILTYYFTGAKIKKDKKMPSKVKYGDKKYSLKQYLQRVTQAEIGGNASYETIKAQVVACYTYAKNRNFKIKSYEHAFSSKSAVSKKVKKAVNKVMGEYVAYNGKACMTPYHSVSAGKTASSKNAWGADYPYLVAVESEKDKKREQWKATVKISSKDIKKAAEEAYGIKLKGDPSKWIKILEADDAVSPYIGYVSKVKIGSKTVSGEQFRTHILGYRIKSHCFTVDYTPKK